MRFMKKILSRWKIKSLFDLQTNSVYEQSNNIPIYLKKGLFKGVVYCYGQVKIQEESDRVRLHFEYIPIKGQDIIESHKTEFIKLAGDILSYLITKEKIPLETKNVNDAEDRIKDPIYDDMEE